MINKEISVVVVTYNQEATIARTLDSILAQDFDLPYEIVVGDDASTDATRSILMDYRDRYPEIIRLRLLPINRGVRENYITCLLDTRGRYIADCAGDDFWSDTTKLRRQYEILESDPEISLVHTAWEYYDESTGTRRPGDPDGERASYCQPMVDGTVLLPAIVGHYNHLTVHLCSALYRFDRFMEAYIEDADIFRSQKYPCEDLQLTAVMAASGKIAFIDTPMLCYAYGGDTVSHPKNPSREFEYFWGVLNLTRRLQQKFSIADDTVKPYYQRVVNHMLSLALKLDDRSLLRDIEQLDIPHSVRESLLGNKLVWPLARAVKNLKK